MKEAQRIRALKIGIRIAELLLLDEREIISLCGKDIIPSIHNNTNYSPKYYPPALKFIPELVGSSIKGFCWERKIAYFRRIWALETNHIDVKRQKDKFLIILNMVGVVHS